MPRALVSLVLKGMSDEEKKKGGRVAVSKVVNEIKGEYYWKSQVLIASPTRVNFMMFGYGDC